MLNLPKKTLILFAALLFLAAVFVLIIIFQPNKEEKKQDNIVPTLVPEQARDFKNPPPPTFRPISAADNQEGYSVAFQLPPSFSLPSEANIAKVTHALKPTETQSIASIFGFSSLTQTYNNNSLWLKDTSSLTVNTSSGFIKYQNSTPFTEEQKKSPKISAEDAQKIAEGALKKINAANINREAANIKNYKDFSNGEAEEATNPQEIYAYEVSYTQSFQGVPIYLQLGNPSRIVVWIDVFGEIRKIEFFNLSLDAARREKLKDLDTIKNELTNSKATVVRLGSQTDNAAQIRNVIVSNIELAYFDDKTTSFLHPVLVITGSANTAAGTQDIIMYLSAI